VNAILLQEGEPVEGDNTDANYDFINQGVCGPRSDRRALWYEIIGTGKEVTVNVCTNNEKITDFGVFLKCNTQQCKGYPPQLEEPANCDDDNANTYAFVADVGVAYYVHVRSDTLDPVGSNFTIWYTEPSEEPTPAPDSAPQMASSLSFVVTILTATATIGWMLGGGAEVMGV
jgi:hypothetical protein